MLWVSMDETEPSRSSAPVSRDARSRNGGGEATSRSAMAGSVAIRGFLLARERVSGASFQVKNRTRWDFLTRREGTTCVSQQTRREDVDTVSVLCREMKCPLVGHEVNVVGQCLHPRWDWNEWVLVWHALLLQTCEHSNNPHPNAIEGERSGVKGMWPQQSLAMHDLLFSHTREGDAWQVCATDKESNSLQQSELFRTHHHNELH